MRSPAVVAAEMLASCQAVARYTTIVAEEALPALARTAEAESLALAVVRTPVDVAFWAEALGVGTNGVATITAAEAVRAHASAVEAEAVTVAIVRARAHRVYWSRAVAALEPRKAFALTGRIASGPESARSMSRALVRASGLMARVSGEALVAYTFRLDASSVATARDGTDALRASLLQAEVQQRDPGVLLRSPPSWCARAHPLFARAVSVAVLRAGGLVVSTAMLVVAERPIPAILALANVQRYVAVSMPAARVVLATVLLGLLQLLRFLPGIPLGPRGLIF